MGSSCSSLKLTSLHSDVHFLGTRQICGFFSALPWEDSGLPGKTWKRLCRRGEKDQSATT